MNRKAKKTKKMIGYGALVVVPTMFALSLWFTSLGIDNALSIFLIVLIGAIVSFIYYLLFEKVQKLKEEKRKSKKDPFAN